MKRFFRALLIFWALFFPQSVFSGETLLPTSLPIDHIPQTVEVALLVGVSQALISTEAPFEILNQKNSEVLFKTAGPFEVKVVPERSGIAVNGNIYPEKELIFKSRGGLLTVGKRKYRDQIRISKNSEKTITVTNRIKIEDYLKGVLPLEVHPSWPEESLKAQAVISRTFALFKSIEKQNQPFTVKDSVESQVYGGALFHHESTDEAVDATRGEILTFNGKIFPAYFHSNCGGRTTKPDSIWSVRPNPVFKSVACSYCRNTKQWKWALAVPLSEIEAKMQKNGYPAKNLKRIVFSEYDSSGRVSKVILEYPRSKVTLSGIDFRALIGYDQLKSLKASVEIKGKKARFKGYGWGHGIGFCQWGARGQAKIGKSYREILKFYFPEAEIRKV